MYKLIKETYPYYHYKKATKHSKGNIFFIHGFAVNSDYHHYFYDKLDDYDYYAVEHAGHNITPLKNKKQLFPYSYACEVANLIEKLDLKDIILMGHSMGGGISMMVYHMIPHRIKKLVLVTPMNIKGTTNIFNVLFKFNPTKISEIDSFYNVIMHDYFNNHHKLSTKEIEEMLLLQKTCKKEFAILKRKMFSLKNAKYLKQSEKNLNVDTLLIVGKSDGCINPHSTIKNLTRKNSHIKVKLFESSGHTPFLEQTDEYYRIIKNFIED